jgi:signal transduction histidine kinase
VDLREFEGDQFKNVVFARISGGGTILLMLILSFVEPLKKYSPIMLDISLAGMVWVSTAITVYLNFISVTQSANLFTIFLMCFLSKNRWYYPASLLFIIYIIFQWLTYKHGIDTSIPSVKGGIAQFAIFSFLGMGIHIYMQKLYKRDIFSRFELQKRTTELETANKDLEAFAYSISHDLHAPLRHINGFIELLQKRIAATLDEKGQYYMNTIMHSSNRMSMLITDLLTFSRMGQQSLIKSDVNLHKLVEEVVTELEFETQDRAINWHIQELPVVSADETLIRTVLANLISNAIKFTRPRETGEIEIGCKNKEGETIIFIRDNGVGFNPAYSDKLFHIFKRLHHSNDFEGTGIGLANVRQIINRHGGKVWADGVLDKGATFSFSLPLSKKGVH